MKFEIDGHSQVQQHVWEQYINTGRRNVTLDFTILIQNIVLNTNAKSRWVGNHSSISWRLFCIKCLCVTLSYLYVLSQIKPFPFFLSFFTYLFIKLIPNINGKISSSIKTAKWHINGCFLGFQKTMGSNALTSKSISVFGYRWCESAWDTRKSLKKTWVTNNETKNYMPSRNTNTSPLIQWLLGLFERNASDKQTHVCWFFIFLLKEP